MLVFLEGIAFSVIVSFFIAFVSLQHAVIESLQYAVFDSKL